MAPLPVDFGSLLARDARVVVTLLLDVLCLLFRVDLWRFRSDVVFRWNGSFTSGGHVLAVEDEALPDDKWKEVVQSSHRAPCTPMRFGSTVRPIF